MNNMCVLGGGGQEKQISKISHKSSHYTNEWPVFGIFEFIIIYYSANQHSDTHNIHFHMNP
jgi:hypothetical protein